MRRGRRPTGELREWAAMATVERALPELTDAERYAPARRRRCASIAAVGIDRAATRWTGRSRRSTSCASSRRNGDLVQRFVDPFTGSSARVAAGRLGGAASRHRDAHGRRWRAGVAKFFIDGVIDPGTGWLFEPDWRARARCRSGPTRSTIVRRSRLFAAPASSASTHARGDRGVREALDAYREAGATPLRGPPPDRAHRDFPARRPAALRRRGSDRLDAASAHDLVRARPLRQLVAAARPGRSATGRSFPDSLLQSPARSSHSAPTGRSRASTLASGSRLHGCVVRPQRDRRPYDDQALDGLAALEGYTTAAAATIGERERLGRIRPGFAADLTVFADDPVSCDPDELPELPVVLTVVDGEIVHRAA